MPCPAACDGRGAVDRLLPSDPTFWFGIFVVLGATLATVAIWAPRRIVWKIAAIGVTAVMAASAYASLTDLLGRPKPTNLEWAAVAMPEATVVGTRLQEPDAIYLWLQFDGQVAPRAYALPWSMNTARKLQRMMQEAEAQGTSVRTRSSFMTSLDTDEPLFYVRPQEALPAKPRS